MISDLPHDSSLKDFGLRELIESSPLFGDDAAIDAEYTWSLSSLTKDTLYDDV